MKYRHIFFDLDHTLWDHEKNSYETLNLLYKKYDIALLCNTLFEDFFNIYTEINYDLWHEYNHKRIEKSLLRWKRFDLALKKFSIEDENLAKKMADDYLDHCPRGSHLIDDAHEVLDYLAPKYELHIVTNGFKEAQYTKIKSSDLHKYFSEIFISEEVGHLKPDPEIFRKAIQKIESKPDECIMIGDNLKTDIAGAQNAGIDFYFFNPLEVNSEIEEGHQISKLIQLVDLL